MPAALTKEYSCIWIVKGAPLARGRLKPLTMRNGDGARDRAFLSNAGLTIRAHHAIASHVPDERLVEYAQPLDQHAASDSTVPRRGEDRSSRI